MVIEDTKYKNKTFDNIDPSDEEIQNAFNAKLANKLMKIKNRHYIFGLQLSPNGEVGYPPSYILDSVAPLNYDTDVKHVIKLVKQLQSTESNE